MKPLRIFRYLVIIPVRFYKLAISPLLGPSCRFKPTCSDYMLQAVEEWGLVKGLWLGLRRIGKCHPWGPHGYDPVPKKNTDPKTKK